MNDDNQVLPDPLSMPQVSQSNVINDGNPSDSAVSQGGALGMPTSQPLASQPLGMQASQNMTNQAVGQSNLGQPVLTSNNNPTIADDIDLIEKEWVEKAKEIVDKTRSNPYLQNKAISEMKADYIKKRYNKDLTKDD